ncbi:MAG: hypothetical protein ACRD63_13935 [Pyrinomonadaceae bacterium]
MKKIILLGAVALIFGLTTNTFAQYRYGRFNNRSNRVNIGRGFGRGRITHDEAKRIRERRRDFFNDRRSFSSDGRFNRNERRDLRRDRRDYNRTLFRSLNNRNRRNNSNYYRNPGYGYYNSRYYNPNRSYYYPNQNYYYPGQNYYSNQEGLLGGLLGGGLLNLLPGFIR